MNWCLDLPDLPNGPWRVLMLLCDSANQEHGCAWLHVSTIMRRTGMSRSTVLAHTKELHTKGYIVPGDKRYVSHIDRRQRPAVWRPNIHRGKPGDLRGQTLPLDDVEVWRDVRELGRPETRTSESDTLRGPRTRTQNQEHNQTGDPDTAQGDRSAPAREVSDLGSRTPGAVAPEQALDYVAACRAAIRKDRKDQQ